MIIIVTKKLRLMLGAAAILLPLSLCADDELSVDARFDKTGDALVDALDWKKMSEEEKMAYARASILALGEDVEVRLPQGESKAEAYLKGLRAVYE